MTVQNSADLTNLGFIKSGNPYSTDSATIAQDVARTEDLVFGTVMAYVPGSSNWVPYTDIAATDGSALPRAIYIGDDIASADIVAGDVTNSPMLVGGGCSVDVDQVVLENSLTLETVIGSGTIAAITVGDYLKTVGIYTEDTIAIDGFENA